MTSVFLCSQFEEGDKKSTRRDIYAEARVCFKKLVTEFSGSTEEFRAAVPEPGRVSGRPASVACPTESNGSVRADLTLTGTQQGPEQEDKSDQHFDGCVRRRGCGCLTSISA